MQKLYQENSEFRESRLKSLFSDFSHLKESNPEGYRANITVWKHMIQTVLDSDPNLSFKYDDLKKKLKYNSSKYELVPEGLSLVLNEMISKDKSIVLLSDVVNKENKSGILGAIKSLLFGNELDVTNITDELVLLSKLQNLAKQIKAIMMPILQSGPINVNHLSKVLKENQLEVTNKDLNSVLSYLSKQNSGIFVSDIMIYKSEESLQNGDNSELEDMKHLTDLKFTIYQLDRYNAEKAKEIKKLDSDIRELIKEGNQQQAKSKLKLKKILELQVKKTLSSLENLHTLQVKIEDAQNNLLITKLWKQNSDILKILNEKANKDNNLDEFFDTLYDEIQNTDEISDKLGASLLNKNDESIEAELNELENKVNNEKEIDKANIEKNKEDAEFEEIQKKLKDLKIPNTVPGKDNIDISKKEDSEEEANHEERVAMHA